MSGGAGLHRNTMIDLKLDVPLEGLTTFGLRSTAEAYAEAATTDELRAALAAARERNLPVHFLGGGANTVAMPRVKGLVVRVTMKGFDARRAADGDVLVTAAAGEVWDEVVSRTVAQGFGGLENLAAVPGTVGGAVVQNIGAYGLELAERLESVTVYDRSSESVRMLTREACDFGYRHSIFKTEAGKDLVVLSATLRLPGEWSPVMTYKGLDEALGDAEPTPAALEAVVRAIRAKKLPDPKVLGNAGSFFKNPVVPKVVARPLLTVHQSLVAYPLGGARVKLAAGWLIEQAGFKGYRSGPVGVCENHALILVNYGGATGEDVLRLMKEITAGVETKFGIALEPEPVFLE